MVKMVFKKNNNICRFKKKNPLGTLTHKPEITKDLA